jgi:hypothetical protein
MQQKLRTLLLGGGLAIMSVAPAMAQTVTTLTRAVSSGSDDAEEYVPGGTGTIGSMDLSSSDLEIMFDGTKKQLVGTRFTNVTIPQGASIVSAYIQFSNKGDKTPVLGTAVIRGEAANNSATFTTNNFDISTRTLTTDSVSWPGSTSTTWGTTTGGTAGPDQKTPDIKTLIQAIVSRPGWVSGNALSLVLNGEGVRNAYSYDGSASGAAQLIVEYSATPLSPNSMPITSYPVTKFSNWRYLDNGTNQGTNWRGTSFVDTTWAFGPGKLGYSDNPATTLSYGPSSSNKYITYYFRKPINVASLSALTDTLELNILRDDGAIVYINGTEVVRTNMPTGTIDYLTWSSAIVDGADESTYFTYHVPKSVMVAGTNIIAVEVHQRDGTSSDLGFDMELKNYVAPVAPTQSLLRGPYLMVGTTTSMNVRWRTTLPAKSVVRYGLAPNALNQVKIDSAEVTEHEVKLSGLAPHTQYWYSIGSLTDTLQGDSANYFMTVRPAGDRSAKQRIGVIGDCGNNSTNQKNVRDQLIGYLGDNYMDSWILLGDNAYSSGTDAEFQAEFFNIYKDRFLKQNPLYPAPGNHDYSNGNATRQLDHAVPYYSLFSMPTQAEAGGYASGTKAFYSFDNGNVHFLSLDSYGKEDSATRLYDTLGAQVQWIKADLAANANKEWVVAYWHHPPYTMGSHNSDTETELVKIRENFIRILERSGVDLILCGHSHDYERSKLMMGHYGNENSFDSTIHNLSQSSGLYDGSNNSCPYLKDSVANFQGTVYVVSGSAGQLGGSQAGYPHNAMAAYSDASHGGAMVLEVEGNRLDAKWICADGSIRDQFTLMKNTNFSKTYTINEGDSITLTAGFNGRYSWTGVTDTTQSVRVSPTDTMTYVVKDVYDCVADSFHVNVIPKVVTPTGISNVAVATNDIVLAPNPAHNNAMNIFLKKNSNLKAKLQLTDAAGRVLMTKEMVLNNTPQRFLPELQKGIYILSVLSEEGLVSKKVIIE